MASSSRSRSWLITSSAPRYAAQEPQQPVAGVGVEVVGGLVEQQQVAAGEEDAGQLEASPLATGEGAEGEVEPVGAQAETVDEAADLGVGGVAPVVLEALLGVGEPDDVAVGRVLLEGDPELLEVVGGLVEAAARQDVGEAVGVVGDGLLAGVLGEVAGGARRVGSVPDLAGAAPPSVLKSVVLPAPLRPTRPTLSPARTWKVTPSTMVLPPISTTRSLTFSTGPVNHRCGPAPTPDCSRSARVQGE